MGRLVNLLTNIKLGFKTCKAHTNNPAYLAVVSVMKKTFFKRFMSGVIVFNFFLATAAAYK
jgi:hypothetical protein